MTNKLLLLLAMAAITISSKSLAKTNGFNITIESGYTLAHYDNTSFDANYYGPGSAQAYATYTYKRSNIRNAALRLALGYDVTKYLSLELGASKYGNSNLETTVVSTTNNAILQTTNTKIKNSVLDLLLTSTLPIEQYFVYAKTGLAVVYSRYKNDYATANQADGTQIENSSDEEHTIFYRPEVVLGAGFNINENFALEASYSRIFGENNIKNTAHYLPNLDYMALGFTFRFE